MAAMTGEKNRIRDDVDEDSKERMWASEEWATEPKLKGAVEPITSSCHLL
jgi:hypothetical protein